MKRLQLTVLAALLALWPVAARADTGKIMADVAGKAGALVMIKATVEDEMASRPARGQAICIDPSGGFITLALSPPSQSENIKDISLIIPGAEGKTVKAELIGIDPSGIGFIRASEPHKWTAIQFADKVDLPVGTQVISVGLLPAETGYAPYFGAAYVSTTIRIPEQLIYVTGGRLTGIGSPVFTADGRAVGIVGRQLFLSYQMLTNRGTAPLALMGQQETVYFLSVNEFSQIISRIPTPGQLRKLPWIGVMEFDGMDKDFAELAGIDQAGVVINQVVPSGIGEKAGLKDRDVILAINGKPVEQLATTTLTGRNFSRQIMYMSVGEELTLTVRSGSDTKTVTLTLEAMPTRPNEAKRYFNKGLGLSVREKVLLDKYIGKSPTAEIPGLLILYVARESEADIGGLRVSDVITNVNNQAVQTVDGFKQALEGALTETPGEAINFVIHRGQEPETISVQPPTPTP